MSEGAQVSFEAARRAYEKWKVGKCSYECGICGAILSHSLKFYRHLAEKHPDAGGPTGYSRSYGSALVSSKQMKCKMCRESILYDYGEMKAHFKSRKHRHADLRRPSSVVELPQYFVLYEYKLYHLRSKNLPQQEQEGQKGPGDQEPKETKAPEDVDGNNSKAACEGVREEDVYHLRFKDVRKLKFENKKNTKVKSDAANRIFTNQLHPDCCYLHCPICALSSPVFQTWKALLVHIKKTHSEEEMAPFEIVAGERRELDKEKFLLDPLFYYRCLECDKELCADRRVVGQHVLLMHGIFLREYIARHKPSFRYKQRQTSFTYQVENCCQFKCPRCPVEVDCLDKLSVHLVKQHKLRYYYYVFLCLFRTSSTNAL